MKLSLRRSAEWFVLVSGVLFGLIGGLWSLVFVDRGDEALRVLTERRSETTHRIEQINATAANYFLANQQGDLIYLLASQPQIQHDLAKLLLRGNLLDRATPVREMIGVLALARQLTYRETYDAYEKLNDIARSDLSFANYSAVKQREADLVDRGLKLVPVLLDAQAQNLKDIEAQEASRRRNRVLGVAASAFGNFLLLIANLIDKRKVAKPSAEAEAAA